MARSVFHLRDAGHILGSARVEILVDEGAEPPRPVFSGDLDWSVEVPHYGQEIALEDRSSG
jgi:hypothetical protein